MGGERERVGEGEPMARTPPLRSACAKLLSTASDASEGGEEGEEEGEGASE